MDSRDVLILGLVGAGGYFAWRWWKNRPIQNAQQTAPSSNASAAASSMQGDAARTTTFGQSLVRRLLAAPISSINLQSARKPLATAPASSLPLPVINQRVVGTLLAPMPNAPSPSGRFVSSTGRFGVLPTQPTGALPAPGDPSPAYILNSSFMK